MKGHRIVDLGLDAARVELASQRVASAFGQDADHVLVKDVRRAGGLGQSDRPVGVAGAAGTHRRR